MTTVIVGGGWAGLSTAVELARHGAAPIVLEAARQLGGRARAVRFRRHHVDNGQHLLIGAYHSVLTLLKMLGVTEERVFRRYRLDLSMKAANGRGVRLAAAGLPAPLHLLWGLLTARGLSARTRLSALRFLRRIQAERFVVNPDRPLAAFLAEARQAPEAVRALWRPLCTTALNTPLERASTQLFLHVIRDAFFTMRRDSDLLVPITDLGSCLPVPAMDFIEQRGGSVRLASPVQAIEVHEGAVTGVVLRDRRLDARHVVVATAPVNCAELLRAHAACTDIVANLDRLAANPICTLYLQYPEHVTLGRDFIGMLDTTTQWVFDHGRLTGSRGLIAAVISGPGTHMRLNNASLGELVSAEIALSFPSWPPPIEIKVIREKRATLASVSDIDSLRPAQSTPIKGLWLAGDYTTIGYPSTLEGAVLSGLLCARRLLKEERRT